MKKKLTVKSLLFCWLLSIVSLTATHGGKSVKIVNISTSRLPQSVIVEVDVMQEKLFY